METLMLPATANVASLSSSGSSTTVVLFSGFGSDFSNPQSGLNQLNTSLQNQFGGTNSSFNSRVFSYSQQEEAFNYINSFPDGGSLGIIGYSFGGDTAFDLARDFPAVDLLIQIDSVGQLAGFGDEVLPGNVVKGINYYQSNPTLQNRSFLRRLEELAVTQLVEKDVKGADNINVEMLFNDRTITHTSIDNDLRVHQLISGNITEFLIQPSNFGEIL